MQYKTVNNDIKLIEKSKTSDLVVKIRLFELYTEKHRLIDAKEKELDIYGGKGAKKKIKQFKKIKSNTLKKIEYLSSKIIKFVKNKDILAKIYYYKAQSYHLEKRNILFYKNLKKAESYVSNIQYKKQIYNHLADYLYNEKQFAMAMVYYKKLIKLPKDRWRKKYYFNLSWIYLKLNKSKKAIRTLQKIYSFPKGKNYHELGPMLDRTLILFYAIAKDIKGGLYFLKKNNLNTFDNLTLLLKYTSEHGSKSKALLVLNALRKTKKTITQRAILLKIAIEHQRAERKYSQIHVDIVKFSKFKKFFKNIEKNERNELITGIKNYTGLLQVLLKSKAISTDSQRATILKYVLFNFDVLSKIDQKNEIEYQYLKGESTLAIGKYSLALSFYKKSIAAFAKLKKKDSNRIAPVYDSLYFCLGKLEKDESYIPNLIWGYKSYLAFQPKGKLSDKIFQNLIGLYFEKKELHSVPSLLRKYNKHYPEKIQLQKKYYKKLISTLIKNKNIKGLSSLRNVVKGGLLGHREKEVKNITLIINELYFKRFDDLNKQGKFEEALKGFKGIVLNKKNDYDLRIDALINILKINHQHKMYDELNVNLNFFMKVATPSVLNKHIGKIQYYVEYLCSHNIDNACLTQVTFLEKNLKKALTDFLVEKLFKLSLFDRKFNYAIKLLKKYPQHYDYVKQSVLLTEFSTLIEILRVVQNQKFLMQITPDLKYLAWTYAFSSKDHSAFTIFKNKTKDITVFQNINKMISAEIKSLNKQLKDIPLLEIPAPITFESFSAYLKKLLGENQKINETIDNIIKDVNPYLTFSALSYAIKYYDNLTNYLGKFIPNAPDKNLNTAIKKELTSIAQIYRTKIKSYFDLKKKLLNKVSDNAGSAKLFHRDFHGTFQTRQFQRSFLWK